MVGIPKKGIAFLCTLRFQGHRYYFAVGQVWPPGEVVLTAETLVLNIPALQSRWGTSDGN